MIEETLCPICKSRMKPMNGKYGKYWKCVRPFCQGTRDSMGRSKEEREKEKDERD